jgi:hypothetical protein
MVLAQPVGRLGVRHEQTVCVLCAPEPFERALHTEALGALHFGFALYALLRSRPAQLPYDALETLKLALVEEAREDVARFCDGLRRRRKALAESPVAFLGWQSTSCPCAKKHTLKKKMQVLVARRTLLEDRLVAYEHEVEYRIR